MSARRFIVAATLLLGAIAALYPFVWMLSTSLKTLQESTTASLNLIPAIPQWQNYPDALNSAPFARYFGNTFAIATTIALATTLSAIMAGYAFARLNFLGRRVLFALILATMMVPFEALIIPNYVLITKLGWYDTYQALIIPWCANAFSIFLMRQAYHSIPNEYYDAARIDGCGHIRFLILIATPMVRPNVLIVGLFAFLASYNALLWPLIVTGSESMRVIQVGLAVFATDAGVRTNLLMAASIVVIAPVLILYFVTQRTFVEAATQSGLKG